MSLVVIGSINMDTTYHMHHLPQTGETILADDISTSRGGKGQNQAVSMARLGADVSIVGAIGNDKNGEIISKGLLEDEVNIDNLIIKDGSTGIASIYLDENGDNNIVVFPGTNSMLDVEDILKLEELLDKADICVLQLEIPLDVVYKSLEICKKKGIKTILNPAPVARGFNVEYLKYVDILIPNETELELLTNKKIEVDGLENMSKQVLEYGCETVIVTLGSQGSYLYTREKNVYFEARKVEAIDTTAAGDSFVGAVATALDEGNDVEEAIKFATLVASKTVTKKGAINSLPYSDEII